MNAEDRKFLVIADESEECRTALYFAAKRVKATGGKLAILAVTEPPNFDHWIGVGETMRREAEEAATQLLDSLAEEAEAVLGTRPELIMREGRTANCLADLIAEDQAIALLVLGSSESGEGPGPLVTALSRGKGLFEDRPIPVTVVPGGLDRAAIDALT